MTWAALPGGASLTPTMAKNWPARLSAETSAPRLRRAETRVRGEEGGGVAPAGHDHGGAAGMSATKRARFSLSKALAVVSKPCMAVTSPRGRVQHGDVDPLPPGGAVGLLTVLVEEGDERAVGEGFDVARPRADSPPCCRFGGCRGSLGGGRPTRPIADQGGSTRRSTANRARPRSLPASYPLTADCSTPCRSPSRQWTGSGPHRRRGEHGRSPDRRRRG